MTDEISVPPSHIPKLYPLCMKCGHPSYSIMGKAHADGYFRRHRCRDMACSHAFYTLTPYDGSAAKASLYPFKDRPLTDAEIDQREAWWAEYTFGEAARIDVEPFERMRLAFLKPEGERDDIDNFLVDMNSQLTQALKEMEE